MQVSRAQRDDCVIVPAMGTKSRQPGPPAPELPAAAEEMRFLVQALAALTRVAERLGIAFAVLVVLLAAVWMLGSAQTRDDFLRELLFGSITHTRYLSLFFG